MLALYTINQYSYSASISATVCYSPLQKFGCQKHYFGKLKEPKIIARLWVLVEKEKLDVGGEALSLVASRAEGSIQDAEVVSINSASWIKRTLFPWCKNSHVASKQKLYFSSRTL
jgi:hypothetical protein